MKSKSELRLQLTALFGTFLGLEMTMSSETNSDFYVVDPVDYEHGPLPNARFIGGGLHDHSLVAIQKTSLSGSVQTKDQYSTFGQHALMSVYDQFDLM